MRIFAYIALVVSAQAWAQSLPAGCESESGLVGRTDVIHCQAFESATWFHDPAYVKDACYRAGGVHGAPFVCRSAQSDGPDLSEIVTSAGAGSTGCISGNCMKVNMPRWQDGGAGGALAHQYLIPGNREVVYLRYYLKLAPNFSPSNFYTSNGLFAGSGGKFPGLADARTNDPSTPGTDEQCGNGHERSDGINCWSARAKYRDCLITRSDEGPINSDACAADLDGKQATTRWGHYWYLVGDGDTNEAMGAWDEKITGTPNTGCATAHGLNCGIGPAGLVNDRWYLMEWYIAMNTPGVADGVARGWIDGVLKYEKTNVLYRHVGHDDLHVRTVWLNVHAGGENVGPAETTAVYMDQMVVIDASGWDGDMSRRPGAWRAGR